MYAPDCMMPKYSILKSLTVKNIRQMYSIRVPLAGANFPYILGILRHKICSKTVKNNDFKPYLVLIFFLFNEKAI